MCESKNNALADPKNVLHSTETTDGVLQSEKTSLLFPHSEGAIPTSAHSETDGTYDNELKLEFYDYFHALVLVRKEHHDGGTGTGRDEPTSTQAAEATGIHTTTIAMIFYSPYHNYTGSLSTDILPDAAISLAEAGKTKCL